MNIKLNFRHIAQIADKFYHTALLVFWLCMLYGSDEIAVATSTLLCVAVHEVSHVAILQTRGRLLCPRARAYGFKISIKDFSYRQKMIATAAGPLANLLCALLLLPFIKYSPYLAELAFLNFMTALSNLIPISGTDGYNLIFFTLENASTQKRAYLILESVSLALNIFIFLVSAYIVLRIGESFWIWAIFFFSLVRNLETYRKMLFLRF